ncbi:uncharacterized protein DNG_02717 [Cephalotrichum gorgonifer]|uniref:Mid2 domain-containing protein n=1 Tax=Cephalotrichum gorgonifer TaxID=2041049 RepID=A0AAE8STJ1_9PEZI|nr:uncharacterized protein DNG_02717 [Cephalotrichum gorgonifer]
MPPPTDLFRKLPLPTISLLLAALSPHVGAYVLPRQTTTLAHRTLAVELWPPLPTEPPSPPPPHPLLLPRQSPNTICGFVDGDLALPVTCGPGSHCVVDRAAGAIGCCPDGEDACTTGVFTGCVDGGGATQGVADPYVFTCTGADVCYSNVFDGGLTQVGCGTGTDLAASVAMTADGATPLRFETVDVGITGSSASTSSSSQTTSSASRGEEATATEEADAPDSDGGVNQTGAIIGGTLSGVAVMVALMALGYFFWRKRAGNKRTGPPTLDTKYISPLSNNSRVGFTPVATSRENAETGLAGYENPSIPPPAAGGGGPEYSQVPGEFDDWHRGYGEVLTNIREEDEGVAAGPGAGTGARGSGGLQGGDGTDVDTPLWQQNRRQSRNMMWM